MHVKRTSRGPGFSIQHPHGSSQPWITPATLLTSAGFFMHVVHRHMPRHAQTQMILYAELCVSITYLIEMNTGRTAEGVSPKNHKPLATV